MPKKEVCSCVQRILDMMRSCSNFPSLYFLFLCQIEFISRLELLFLTLKLHFFPLDAAARKKSNSSVKKRNFSWSYFSSRCRKMRIICSAVEAYFSAKG
jgi:hypothetical protein